MFPELILSILKDKNLKGSQKVIFKTFSVIKFFTHKLKYNDLNHVNISFTDLSYIIFWLILKYNMVFKNWWKKDYSLKEEFLGPLACDTERESSLILCFSLFEPRILIERILTKNWHTLQSWPGPGLDLPESWTLEF